MRTNDAKFCGILPLSKNFPYSECGIRIVLFGNEVDCIENRQVLQALSLSAC